MSVIDTIMQLETAVWLNGQLDELPDRAKFRAASALRSLQWANDIFEASMAIPACFCALHATEEAVAAFISCAKECGYVDAKMINIKDHAAKSTISLLVQKVSNILYPYEVAVGVNSKTDNIAVRYVLDGQTYYNEASAKLFHFGDPEEKVPSDFYDALVVMFGDVAELEAAVKIGQEARNKIFYATSTGYPTGFDVPEDSLARECKISLGLIWAALDMKRNEGELIPFYEQALRTAAMVIAALKKK